MKEFQPFEWLRVGVLLAFAGGILDAYTFLWRGEVLATAETGNLVMMGLNIVRGDWSKALSYIFPIVAFALGAYVANRMRASQNGHYRTVLAVEMVIIALATLLPLGHGDAITNISISFVSALQVSSFRAFRGCPAFTTMCTGNIRSMMDNLEVWQRTGEEATRAQVALYASIISAFIVGVLVCDFLSVQLGQYTGLVACLPLLISYCIIRK